jgi:hypothetical protein
MRSGSMVIQLSEGIRTRVIVFRLSGGEREALITKAEEGEIEASAFSLQSPIEQLRGRQEWEQAFAVLVS